MDNKTAERLIEAIEANTERLEYIGGLLDEYLERGRERPTAPTSDKARKYLDGPEQP